VSATRTRALASLPIAVALGLVVVCEGAPRTSAATLTGSPRTAMRPASGSITIPEGAGGDLAKRQLAVLAEIEAVQDPKSQFQVSKDTLQAARLMIEAQLPRMKRFTVYSIYNEGAGRKVRELADTGLAKDVEAEELPEFDLFLNISAIARVERNIDKTRAQEWVVCAVNLVYTLTDKSKKVLTDTQYASGTITTPAPKPGESLDNMRNVRKIEKEFDPVAKKWVFIAGFDPNDESSTSALVKQTIQDPLKGLAARLALALPITTQVTSLNPSKTQFAVRAGQRNGLFKGTEVVVWCEQGDFSYPIASAIAEPTMEKSNLKIVSWNEEDPEAREIIAKIKSGGIPDDSKGKIWATTKGIPLEEMLAP
jgi:hypothetical protein